MKKYSEEQEKTIKSLIKHSDNIYSLTYYNDYNLDYMLSKQVTSIFGILKVANKIQKNIKKYHVPKLPLGCSTFYCQNEKQEKILARNFDYRSSPCLVMKTNPKNGYKSISICDLNFMLYGFKHTPDKNHHRLLLAPYMAMDGMNEKGFAVSVLELNDKPCKQKNGKPKINTSLMIRYLLDKCSNVDEGIKAFEDFEMHSSIGYNYHFHLADPFQSVVIEYVNHHLQIIRPSSNHQCLTNFYLSETGNNSRTKGKDRYQLLEEELMHNKGIIKQDCILPLLTKTNQYYKFTYKFFLRYYVETCYSAIYNLNKLEITVAKNNQQFTFKINSD